MTKPNRKIVLIMTDTQGANVAWVEGVIGMDAYLEISGMRRIAKWKKSGL